MEKTYTTEELISFSRENALMRNRAIEILALVREEDAAGTKLNDDYYVIDSQEWLKRYDEIKSQQKRIKLKIHSFVRRHYGESSICVKEYVGMDYVDMVCKFFRIAESIYGVQCSFSK